MNRFSFLIFCLVSAFLAPLISAADQPNIIFVLSDDLGYGDLGVLFQNSVKGEKKIATPQLDAMAAEGMLLTRHYCPAAVCAPSRGSLLSGQHQGHANVRDNQFDKAIEDNLNLATTLKAAGYYTAIIGKYGLQGGGKKAHSPKDWPAYPTKRGFDYFMGYVRHGDGHIHFPAHKWKIGNSEAHRKPRELYENDQEISQSLRKCYTADLFTARAKKLITERSTKHPKQPFFLYLAYDTPHGGLQIPTQAYPEGRGLKGGVQWLGKPGKMINTASGKVDSWFNPKYAQQPWPETHRRFATIVTRLDNCVGDVLQTLRDLKIDHNTIVIFSSDNGPHSESYIKKQPYAPTAFKSYANLTGMKRDSYEGGIRVPTVAWWPGQVKGGSKSSRPSQFHDWLATFCDAAGVSTPARADGVSLLPTLTGKGKQKPGTVYVEYTVGGKLPNYPDYPAHQGEPRRQSQAIYLDGYKGIRTGITSHADDFKIYDTLKDPGEEHNLAEVSFFYKTLQRRMKDKVLRIRQVNESAPRPYDKELVPPVTAKVVSGLSFSIFEGKWNWIPRFDDLKPATVGTVKTMTLPENKLTGPGGLLFTGYIRIPQDGLWKFHADSDSGVVLRIHDSLVIDDDYSHSDAEATGSIRLKTGLHPVRLYYRNGKSAPKLSLSWTGPDSEKAVIPASALFRPAGKK